MSKIMRRFLYFSFYLNCIISCCSVLFSVAGLDLLFLHLISAYLFVSPSPSLSLSLHMPVLLSIWILISLLLCLSIYFIINQMILLQRRRKLTGAVTPLILREVMYMMRCTITMRTGIRIYSKKIIRMFRYLREKICL